MCGYMFNEQVGKKKKQKRNGSSIDEDEVLDFV